MQGRKEYLLDLSREDVRNYIIGIFDQYLKDGDIDYIKWDMNRPITDANSVLLGKDRKQEIYHRYILGLYEILEKVTKQYPKVLFEGCSSGGARFDPGILYYVGQNWCSDNTDGFDRVEIQSGFGLLYPPICMSAHVSITPNHQTGRSTSLDTRYKVAKLFNLGYELDLKLCSQEELSKIKKQIADYKSMQKSVIDGILYQHNTWNENYKMWSLYDSKKAECYVMIFQKLHSPLSARGLFKIPYLEEDAVYCETSSNKLYGGDELRNIGVSAIHLACMILKPLAFGIVGVLGIMLGADAVSVFVNSIPDVVMNGLTVAGQTLPALGMAMLLNMLWDKQIAAFMFLGFVLYAYLKLPLIAICVIGAVIAIYVSFKEMEDRKRVVPAAANVDDEEDFFND